MKKSYLFFILIFAFLLPPLSAQLTPATAIAEMGRGINLGNTLEPPLEGGWNNGPAQESYFDTYLAAGFTNIRIPVRWDQHTGNTAPFAIDSAWMNRVEQVVDWGLSRGFYITLNGHHEDWLKNNYSNTTFRARYDSIWVQIAERFKNKSEKLLFEIINEPKGMTVAQVDELNLRILGIIRANNPTRIVIYGGNEWANSNELLNAAIPVDNYLIGYYHAYDPWQFSGLGTGTWGTASDYQQLTNKYTSVKNWSNTNNIPVFHSEFGAVLTCDYNSRMRIYAHNVEQCIVNNFAFAVWDDGGDFRILNRGANTWPEVKDILMHYHEDSPNQIFSTLTPDPVTDSTTIVVDWNNRATGNGNFILERAVGGSNNFVQIADLSPATTTYTDLNVSPGNTYTYRMYTTRADGTVLHGYPTRVRVLATTQAPFTGSALPIPGTLEVEEYDLGGEGLAYHDSDLANIPNSFRMDEGVDIGAHGNGYILGYVVSGEWIEYTVNVSQSGIYQVDAEVASEINNGTFKISFDKNNASTTFSTPSTGNWNVFQQITADNTIALEAGEQQMRLDITNNNAFNLDNLVFTLVSATSISESEMLEAQFVVSPNPTSGILQIDLPEVLVGTENQLELINVTGERVGIYSVSGTSTTIDVSELAQGLYFVRLIHEDISLMQKVVKY